MILKFYSLKSAMYVHLFGYLFHSIFRVLRLSLDDKIIVFTRIQILCRKNHIKIETYKHLACIYRLNENRIISMIFKNNI